MPTAPRARVPRLLPVASAGALTVVAAGGASAATGVSVACVSISDVSLARPDAGSAADVVEHGAFSRHEFPIVAVRAQGQAENAPTAPVRPLRSPAREGRGVEPGAAGADDEEAHAALRVHPAVGV